MKLVRSIWRKVLGGLLGSFLLASGLQSSVESAERLEVQFEDMSIPIPVNELSEWVDGMSIPNSIKELSEWARGKGSNYSELSSWLDLLDLESRASLAKLLKAPLIKDRSMARQMLRSWVGRKLLDEISDLVRLDEDMSGRKVFETLENLLDSQPSVNTLDLLEALPAKSIHLDLDGLLEIANNWRKELKSQQKLVAKLGLLSLSSKNSLDNTLDNQVFLENSWESKFLSVKHRSEPLNIEIWRPPTLRFQRSNWIVFMPGLGGDREHFRWLARRLSLNGWPVVLLQHPGSDSKSVQKLLEGKGSAPGAEVLPDRLFDLQAVLSAKKNGSLDVEGERLILMGHSLGALTAFFASGAVPEEGLSIRCKQALNDLSLTNLSQLLQCQLIDVDLPATTPLPDLDAVVAINSFGSLLWPRDGEQKINKPVLLVGGTYDLITPALSEQLGLLLSTKQNNLSRVVLIQGASHFSPIRVEGQEDDETGDDLFQLGESLVGVQPLSVQNLLAKEIIRFIEGFELGKSLEEKEHKQMDNLSFFILNRSNIIELLEGQ